MGNAQRREAMDALYRHVTYPEALDRWVAATARNRDEVLWGNYRYSDPTRCGIEQELFAEVLGAGRTILEIGAGTGMFCRRLRAHPAAGGHRLVGVDISIEAMRQAHSAGGAEFLVADAESLPLPNGTIDAALCVAALEFMPNPEGAVAEVHRVLRPGGYCLLVLHRAATDPLVLPTAIRMGRRLLRRLARGPSRRDVYSWALGAHRRTIAATRRLGFQVVRRVHLMSYVDVGFWRSLRVPLRLLIKLAAALNRWGVSYTQNLTAYLLCKQAI